MIEISSLRQNIIDQIHEANLKLGLFDDTIRLFYPLGSLNAILSTDFASVSDLLVELDNNPIAFSSPVETDVSADRLVFIIKPDNVRYICENYLPKGFIVNLLTYLEKTHSHTDLNTGYDFESVKSGLFDFIDSLNLEYSVEYVDPSFGFDFSVHFSDNNYDSYYYCFDIDEGHITYHRLLPHDYLELFKA